ncbi:T9SS type A sorting domain-containing protein [bacterium]|nr:T9SS type A sorting domain-containing protein [bacterium]
MHSDAFPTGEIRGQLIEDVPLPVTLGSFSGSYKNGQVTLNWKTESEVDNKGFVIYRAESLDGNYKKIASYQTHKVLDGQGTKASETSYTFVDKDELTQESTYYYRLNSEDFDGTIHEYKDRTISVKTGIPDVQANNNSDYELKQNFPNPFNPTTTIPYSIKKAGEISVSIFNILGQEIRSFSALHTEPSEGSFVWDGKDNNGNLVTSGVYFYKMEANNFTSIKKAILVK